MTITTNKVAENFFVAAQLNADSMKDIAAQGFRAVINNRPDFEEGPNQPTHASIKASAEAAGLQYAFVPIPPSSFTPADAALMRAALANLPGPVLAFCRSGRRSAALFQAAKA